ncbi:cobalamin B12-binding domain-containing protein [Thiobaca trueperi]|uniref:Methanogenic corrinoid protein MtbC1 n=1 Tax=Thiobaca trueperi TaxID=127458 RepID=A0A4R3N1D1_9GAMM|nr:cobalamin-dependent protein [Thiobaca trueperi]TCT22840.1 methanogenic corrinoid protein MtbC1 [Thiobaca trueperi]
MPLPSEALQQSFLALDRMRASELVAVAATELPPLQVIETMVRPALEAIGQLWEQGDCALSQVYMSGRICEELIDGLLVGSASDASRILTPQVAAPRLAIAVLEDYHLLGRQIVRTVLRAGGYEVLDYGRQDVEELLDRVCADRIEILLVSTLMLPSALRTRMLIDGLRRVSPQTRVVVGGAPYRFDDQLWQEVGADAVGLHAGEALTIVNRLTGEAP